MPISDALKRIYASAPAGRFYVDTIELAHSAFPQTFFLNNAMKAWTFKLESGVSQLFSPVPFQLVFPTVDGKGQQDLQLVIDNVGRDAMEAIEAAAEYPQENIAVTVRVYINSENSLPQNDPPLNLTLSEVEVSRTAITGTATRADVLNRIFPSVLYRMDTFPGLDR